MSQVPTQKQIQEPPAMGERRARWGYGYQDKIATERILNLLRENLRAGGPVFEGIRLADLDAGRVDDFVLVWEKMVEGNSIKWSGEANPLNWGDLIGANGLFKELADGYQRLKSRWPGKAVFVRFQSNRPPSTEIHQAQIISAISVAEFVRDHWSSGPTAHESVEVTAAWLKISEHVSLTGAEFSEFAKSCNLSLGHPDPPGSGPDSQDWLHYKKQFEDLHKAIATWLTNNPHTDFIDRDFLLSAIGFKGYRSGLIQRFPYPNIPYSKNGLSADKLKQLVDITKGGYIAVVGPAGIGKSTLVQDVLSDAQFPYFIPYYAFLPSTDGNRDRGEALTFFHEVIGRLDKFFAHRYSLGISDIAQGREALRQHMSKANEQYIIQGHKTILLIDGLDHVSREINLQDTFLQELPSPGEVPDGFLIILSSQPQALIPGTIAPQVGNVVGPQSKRRIEISGLTRSEVHHILEKIDKVTTGTERDALHSASQGNPLILTYLLNLFQRTVEVTVEEAISLAGDYTGNIDEYYQTRLAIPLQDGQRRNLLGLLCRAAPTIPIKWLQEWPERAQIEDIYTRILAPFLQDENGNLHFIHNSLITFLKSETRSKLPGADLNIDEQMFYSSLADRCGNRLCEEPLGRARIFHLLRALRERELLRIISSAWIRQGIEALLPYVLVQPLLLAGLEAAWNIGEIGQVLRLILLDYELDQRSSRIEAGDLAKSLLLLDKPELAVSHIRALGRLLVEDEVALGFAHNVWLYANSRNLTELKDTARVLYSQSKPVSFFYQNDLKDTLQQHEYYSILQAWSEVAPLFEECGNIIDQINNLHIKDFKHGEKVDEAEMKASLLYGALGTTLEVGLDLGSCKILLDEITKLNQATWRFAALLKVAVRNSLQVPLSDLETAYNKSDRIDDIDLTYAKYIYDQGDRNKAIRIVKGLVHIRFGDTRKKHSFGFSDISYTVTLQCLQEMLELTVGIVPAVKDKHEEAYARIETTARKIGVLFADIKKGKKIYNLDDSIRSLLLFHNQPVLFSEFDSQDNYMVIKSKKGIYYQVVQLAAYIGSDGIKSLRDVLLELIHGPAGAQFAPQLRRYFAEELFRRSVLSKEQAVELGLSSTLDANDDDPIQRQEACYANATFLHMVGEETISAQWIKRASEVTAGAGSHKDYHMSVLSEWLSRSIDAALNVVKLSVLEKFARAVEVAGGAGTAEAAIDELQLLLHFEPIRASRFAIELIDRSILNIWQVLFALVMGGAKSGASAELLISLYNHLLSLISPGDTSEVATAILRCFPIEKRIAVSKTMMDFVRTNSLPSERIEVARAFQDALRQDGLGEIILAQGLKPGRDDSSRKSLLYKNSAGETETMDQVAARLSNYDNPAEWNPNPNENTGFDWWSAVKKANIKNISHMNDLLTSFPHPEYYEVDILAWKSAQLLEMGDLVTARLYAMRAIDHAKDRSWHRWLDGAQKKIAYGALMRIDKNESVTLARAQFGKDLASAKLNRYYLLTDISDTLNFLELEWPSEAVFKTIDDYLDQVLAANREAPPFASMNQALLNDCSVDEALCRFLIYLLAFPVVDVGVAARKALSQYASIEGNGLLFLLRDKPCCDPVQLEHILAAVHVGSRSNVFLVNSLRDWILNLNKKESIAVRGIARRICEEQRWQWREINNQPKHPVILLSENMANLPDYEEARMLVGGGIAMTPRLYRNIFVWLEDAGLDPNELRSEFFQLFRNIEKEYSWADENRLKCWIERVMARFWLNPRAIVGREAAMRVLGRRSLSGQVPPSAEKFYDSFYPIYDPELELIRAVQRPVEMLAMYWDLFGDCAKAWLGGENADSWSDYPESIDNLYIIGERSFFIRPDWEWPREERSRGLVIGPCDIGQTKKCLESSHELTFNEYQRGVGQREGQLIVLNSERQLTGPVYRWAAINSLFARELGWQLSEGDPFSWIDSVGNLMVKSVFWKDGWIWIEPSRLEALGEGWLVLASAKGMKSIRAASKNIELHLWIERHSHGEKPYQGKWHLSKNI